MKPRDVCRLLNPESRLNLVTRPVQHEAPEAEEVDQLIAQVHMQVWLGWQWWSQQALLKAGTTGEGGTLTLLGAQVCCGVARS